MYYYWIFVLPSAKMVKNGHILVRLAELAAPFFSASFEFKVFVCGGVLALKQEILSHRANEHEPKKKTMTKIGQLKNDVADTNSVYLCIRFQETNLKKKNTFTWKKERHKTNESEKSGALWKYVYVLYNQAFLFMLQKIREIVLRLFLFYLKVRTSRSVCVCVCSVFLILISAISCMIMLGEGGDGVHSRSAPKMYKNAIFNIFPLLLPRNEFHIYHIKWRTGCLHVSSHHFHCSPSSPFAVA